MSEFKSSRWKISTTRKILGGNKSKQIFVSKLIPPKYN